MAILVYHCIYLIFLGDVYLIGKGRIKMHVVLLNTSNGAAFEMRFHDEQQMERYLVQNPSLSFVSMNYSYLPTRHVRMQYMTVIQ